MLMMIMNAFKILFGTILGNDFYIFFAAIMTSVVFLAVRSFAKVIKRDMKAIIKEGNKLYAKRLYNWTSRGYTIFITLISIFPLLGMFGTVCGLLGLDLAAGNMENIKANFFIALTSTAWGIIFSILYKILHAFFADEIESCIEAIKKVYDELEK